jgi:diguanylate cyclase (GGDEF)-like protein/PAS domain S-box-containing protein
MLHRIKRAIKAPEFNNHRLNRLASILNTMILVMLACSILFGITLTISSPKPVITAANFVVLDLLLIVALVAMRRGHIKIAGYIFLLTMWGILTFIATYLHGGLSSPFIDAYILVIVAAGLLLGNRAGYVVAALCLAALVGFFYGEIFGFMPEQIIDITLERSFIFHVFSISLTVALIYITNRSINHEIERAQNNENDLVQRNQQLQVARETLELKVKERTAEILQQSQFFKALVDNSPIAVVTLDMQNRIMACNPAFEKLYGYKSEEVTGKELDNLITNESTRSEAIAYTRNVIEGKNIHSTGVRYRKNGQPIDVEIFGVPVIVGDTQAGVLGMYHDITERKQVEKFLKYIATHDPLTGLPNRALFNDRLNHAIHAAKRQQNGVAVAFMDLDGFKSVNDTFGHEKGDILLVEVAQRLRDSVRESDSVARLGGDEFTFVFENIQNPRDAATVAEKILAAFTRPFEFEGEIVTITASIGISLYPDDDMDASGLLKKADAAMYAAKDFGSNTYELYSYITSA